MKEELFENPVEVRTAVPAPHFDDRRVVWRAQRVVPLDEIRTKLRLRRIWFFSGAFALAMMLGAASALIAVRVKRIAAGNEIPQVEEQETSASVEAQALPVQEEPVAESTVVDEAPVQQTAKPRVAAVKSQAPPVAERPRVVGGSRGGVEPTEDEQLEQIREAVLYEQWQERRMRRAARRERRNRGDRDLSHVDEIFEGPRRPERP
jgi:hypothetical protein